LYLLPGNSQVAVALTTRQNPEFAFGNLQGATNYRMVVDAYKLGGVVASTSVDLTLTNDSAPASRSSSLIVPYIATTFAGNLTQGMVNGTGSQASFKSPIAVAVDPQGTVFVSDAGNQAIRKITSAGVVSLFAGNGTAGSVDGAGVLASFNNPTGVALDPQGNLYVAETGGHRIRKIDAAGNVTTFAGNGVAGNVDGTGTAAALGAPRGIVVDPSGNVYVASEQSGGFIRKISPTGVVSTIAGVGNVGAIDGPALSASFHFPRGIAVNSQGDVFISDCDNGRLRRLRAGVVSTLLSSGKWGDAAGTEAALGISTPWQLTLDAQDNLYVASAVNRQFWRISPTGQVRILAGRGGSGGYQDGTGTSAIFTDVHGIALGPQGCLYVTEAGNNVVRTLQ
jgi:sugar lactone lactonase YvrE